MFLLLHVFLLLQFILATAAKAIGCLEKQQFKNIVEIYEASVLNTMRYQGLNKQVSLKFGVWCIDFR